MFFCFIENLSKCSDVDGLIKIIAVVTLDLYARILPVV